MMQQAQTVTKSTDALTSGKNREEVIHASHLKKSFGKNVVLKDATFSLYRGETLAIVGESGCGKSVSVQSIMGLIPMPPGRITHGTAMLDGQLRARRRHVAGDGGRPRACDRPGDR